MTYLFKDLSKENSYSKIYADSEEDAVLIAIEVMLDNGTLSVEDILNNLDLELIDIENLKAYE